jgi:predicted metalloendopeptidase
MTAATTPAPVFMELSLGPTPAKQDFNAFVNTEWSQKNPIPADQSTWGILHLLADQGLHELKRLVDKTEAGPLAAFKSSFENKEL